MVGQRFDFGQFGHVSSVPVSAARCVTTSDSTQLTIDKTTAAQIAVHQKWSIARPQWVVCSVIHAVIHSISALTTMWNRPSVRM